MIDHNDLNLPTPSLGARRPPVSSKAQCLVDLLVKDADGSLRELPVESWLERNVALILFYRTDIARVVEQQPVVPFSDVDGKSRKHIFDFLVTCHDGRRIAIAVKPKVIADRIGMRDFIARIAAQMPRSLADAACLVTDKDIDPVELRNAELMHACRLGDPADDEIVLAVARSYGGAVTLQDLIAAAGIQGRGYRAAMRLFAAGRLRTLRHEIICDRTLVANTESSL
jgi:hypothetical protein